MGDFAGSRSLLHVPPPLIAIVDDDERMRSSLDNLIRSVGLRACAFPSALAFLEASAQLAPDCLILDVRMPGMTGLELQRKLGGSATPVPIIFVTSHIDDDVKARAIDDGAVAFFYKPFSDDELLEAVDSVVRKDADSDTTKV